jgi:6-phosphofructokinase 1
VSENQEVRTAIGVLTSGGDAPGMNPAVRAVVRTALHENIKVFAVREGYRGLSEGHIDEAGWDYVSGVIDKGGTRIGTTRYPRFELEQGKLDAALNMIERGINRLVVIGGDGSLTGATIFWDQWPHLVKKLKEQGKITAQQAETHTRLALVGLVGSIDNDMCNTDFTIGADTALHRISEAVDAISSTAASHQRIFVVKVMGRHCGYLALMSALMTGADWFLIPEKPSRASDWMREMVDQLKRGIDYKRATIVILAEGATDAGGNLIGSNEVKEALEKGLTREGEEKADVRVTILGHVQRGGAPSAFDRVLSARQGHRAVEELLSGHAYDKPLLVVARGNRLQTVPMIENIAKNNSISEAIDRRQFDGAMELRGSIFQEGRRIARILMKPAVSMPEPAGSPLRFAVMHAGAPAPGMNTATRVAVRLAIDAGCEMVGVDRGLAGLSNGTFRQLDWSEVNCWSSMGGAELGTSRKVPTGREFSRINDQLVRNNINGILMIGGWAGYEGTYGMVEKREIFDSFDIPIVCVPATISGNLPGTEVSIGADTALNNIVDAVDKIKQSAVAAHRCFVVEVSGRYCGYLALMSGLATGAERVYMHEQNLTLEDLLEDLRWLNHEFKDLGRRVALLIRSQEAYRSYDTSFMTALFNEESKGYFDARQAILGHLQHGGNPSPFDRILATRLASYAVDFLKREGRNRENGERELPCIMTGIRDGEVISIDLKTFYNLVEKKYLRAKKPWWLDLKPLATRLAREPR